MGRDSPGNRGLYIGLVQKFDEKTKTAIIKKMIINSKKEMELFSNIPMAIMKNLLKNQ